MSTIAITTFNRADIVGRAVRSALAFADRVGSHVVVVDDGSVDTTYREIQEKFNQ